MVIQRTRNVKEKTDQEGKHPIEVTQGGGGDCGAKGGEVVSPPPGNRAPLASWDQDHT